jgi:hypothetical protein
MFMQHAHVAWTSNMEIQHVHVLHGHSTWRSSKRQLVRVGMKCILDMQQGPAAMACSKDMQHGHAAWTCSMDMQLEHEVRTSRMDVQDGHAMWTNTTGHTALTCSTDMQRDMQQDMKHGQAAFEQQDYAAWTCSMDIDMRHERAARACRMDMQQRHEARTCSIDIQHGHAGWTSTWTCGMDMQQGHAAKI